MKILIIEDQEDKRKDISSFLKSYFQDELYISEQQSLRSGLKEIIDNEDYDLICLDMSMPNFDPSPDDPIGGSSESFAGKELMAQMNLREIDIPVVVITQYSTFSRGQVTLEELHAEFDDRYSDFYIGSVFYSSSINSWKQELACILDRKFSNEK